MKAVMSEFPSLPIDAVLRELCSVLEAGTNAVLQAPPGENGDRFIWGKRGQIYLFLERRFTTSVHILMICHNTHRVRLDRERQ